MEKFSGAVTWQQMPQRKAALLTSLQHHASVKKKKVLWARVAGAH